MSKHTPAPWRLTDDHKTRRVIKGGSPESSVVIVESWTKEADARLIAAAPDLLESAQETIGDYDEKDIRALAAAALNQASLLGGQKEAIASILQHFARGLRLNRAAIAKAKEQQ